MTRQLSKTAQQLIPKAKIVNIAGLLASFPPEIVDIFKAAEAQARFLTPRELSEIAPYSLASPALMNAAQCLHDNIQGIIAETREQLLAQYPQIIQPGGVLYPPTRSEACWRDFWHFLRCITYGIATGNPEFTNPQGLHYLQLLYQELQVPLDVMICGLQHLKAASLKHLPQQQQILAPYFDHLIAQMSRFRLLQ